ncbi:hypothetical protein [Methylocapsa aurea]|uniref:hypothetical protein n=1 Tax=Methylocapsa aurea TaxID=663610 RepID=UPI0012EC29E4|nr:hypothetical protein [Methylocapsa aurea]
MYVEYAGLTHEAATLLERFRQAPDETKSDILVRVLSPLLVPVKVSDFSVLDLGQGVLLHAGERPMLFLSDGSKRKRKPDAVAEIREAGFYLDGKRIEPSKGSVLQPAMRIVQEAKNHRNDKGEIISLSAWRQWHVIREGRLFSMLDLKDPALARRRGVRELTLEDLGL